MVRSNSETGRDFFDLAEQIRGEAKYFNVSRDELARKLAHDSSVSVDADHETEREGARVEIPLRLVISVRRKYWSAALLMHRVRIDGIDWLNAYPAMDGSVGHGWHRHEWDADNLKANIHVPLPRFGESLRTINDFLIRLGSELRIDWSASDVGFINDLPFH